MMKKVIIIHGTMGSPNGNWFQWLKEELSKQGYEVIVPQFPTPEEQNLQNWLEVLNQYIKEIEEGATLIGHSLGGAFILKFLETINFKVGSVYLVSSVIDFIQVSGEECLSKTFNELNSTFVENELDWNKISRNINKINIYHGSNDPYVPVWHSEMIQHNLGGELYIIENGGHLNSEFGYNSFEKLLSDIIVLPEQINRGQR
ncbi:MAG: serine hydrolase family protein [Proteobacteria bacterium]|nr:serine hydrolase family protein [Pseudomonadota bacterium]